SAVLGEVIGQWSDRMAPQRDQSAFAGRADCKQGNARVRRALLAAALICPEQIPRRPHLAALDVGYRSLPFLASVRPPLPRWHAIVSMDAESIGLGARLLVDVVGTAD